MSGEIPDKLYFRIGDVAAICEVPAYVLRFWETEFPQLRPNKGGTGQRLYRKRDVEMALRIKSLLYDQGYTISGARQVFKNEQRAREEAAATAAVPVPEPAVPVAEISRAPAETKNAAERERRLQALRGEMRSLLASLSRPVAGSAPGRLTADRPWTEVQRPPDAGEAALLAEPKLKPMRPRLVLESRSPTSRAHEASRLRLQQRDLFAGDGPDSAG